MEMAMQGMCWTPTWTNTAYLAVFVAVIGTGGLLYARHIARSFDRKWGRPEDWG